MVRLTLLFLSLVLQCLFGDSVYGEEVGRVSLQRLDSKVRVEIDGQLFTEYLYRNQNKPILYPVIGPYEIGMTRNFPMQQEVPGEAHDHIHHRSLWFTHGDINGNDFWTEHERSGKVVYDKILQTIEEPNSATLRTASKWISSEGELICRDRTTIRFSILPAGRVIDWTTTLFADQGELVFGDTKEGTMGIRSHPQLRLTADPAAGVHSVTGKAINSNGVEGIAVWGKRAAWVDYWGEVQGKTVGIAFMDHPSNPRHPAWWHARDYGLIAANHFGAHDFGGKPPGTGDLTLPAGESLTFRYRFIFHKGSSQQAETEVLYEDFSQTLASEMLDP